MDKNEVAKISIIFAMHSKNIHNISKMISLFGALYIVTTLPAKKTLMQCTNHTE